MSAAWSFLFGWISASALIFLCLWREHHRRHHWLDAKDTEVFVQGCEQILDNSRP